MALVVEAVAPDGYSGRIRLLIAMRANGEVVGVRVTPAQGNAGAGRLHRYPQGQEQGAALDHPVRRHALRRERAREQWRVKKDGGRFDQVTGATISARAVTNAVGRALAFAADNREKLFELPTGPSDAPGVRPWT